MATDGTDSYKSAAEIETLVRDFESCALEDSAFDHHAHLLVAFSYLHLSQLTVKEATARMREGLYRFLDYHGHDRAKYNETITVFWVRRVRSFLDHTNMTRTLPDIANEVVGTCGSARLIFHYYSKEHLMSDEARRSWVEPDVRPLDF